MKIDLKPTLGCKPYWVANPQRIEELATAIACRAKSNPLDAKGCVTIEFWAREIIELCVAMVHLEELRDVIKTVEDI